MPPATRLCKIPYMKLNIVHFLTVFLDEFSVLEVISLADIFYYLVLGRPSLVFGQIFKSFDSIPQWTCTVFTFNPSNHSRQLNKLYQNYMEVYIENITLQVRCCLSVTVSCWKWAPVHDPGLVHLTHLDLPQSQVSILLNMFMCFFSIVGVWKEGVAYSFFDVVITVILFCFSYLQNRFVFCCSLSKRFIQWMLLKCS